MAYDKNNWKDGEDGGTPITAERLNHVEDGVEDAAKKADNADKKAGKKADKSALDDKADKDHSHDDYVKQSDYDDLKSKVDNLESKVNDLEESDE